MQQLFYRGVFIFCAANFLSASVYFQIFITQITPYTNYEKTRFSFAKDFKFGI